MITRGNITMGPVMMNHRYRAGRYRTLIIVKVDEDGVVCRS